MKAARLIFGIDDLGKDRGLRLLPRLPFGWEGMCAKDYPVKTSGGVIKENFSYRWEESGFFVSFAADKAALVDYI